MTLSILLTITVLFTSIPAIADEFAVVEALSEASVVTVHQPDNTSPPVMRTLEPTVEANTPQEQSQPPQDSDQPVEDIPADTIPQALPLEEVEPTTEPMPEPTEELPLEESDPVNILAE